MRKYNYFTINVQPKNCDGSGQTEDYLSPKLHEQFRKYVSSMSNRYAIAIEQNSDEVNRHLHVALKTKKPLEVSDIHNTSYNILEQFYDITEAGYKRAIVIRHHTKRSFENTACGYLTKQFETLENNPNYESVGFDTLEINEYKSRYETEVEEHEKKKHETKGIHTKKFILDKNKRICLYKDINTYFKAVQIILEELQELDKINSSNFEKYYIVILQEYKIGYQINSIKKFHRDFLFFLTTINQLTDFDTETLVNFLSFKKLVTNETSYIPNQGYTSSYISEYWSID